MGNRGSSSRNTAEQHVGQAERTEAVGSGAPCWARSEGPPERVEPPQLRAYEYVAAMAGLRLLPGAQRLTVSAVAAMCSTPQ